MIHFLHAPPPPQITPFSDLLGTRGSTPPVATILLCLYKKNLTIKKNCQNKIYSKMHHFEKGCRNMLPNHRCYNIVTIDIEINILEHL